MKGQNRTHGVDSQPWKSGGQYLYMRVVFILFGACLAFEIMATANSYCVYCVNYPILSFQSS